MIIAVDFDGTLCRADWPRIGRPGLVHRLLLAWLKRRQARGDTVILNTCRTGDRLDEAIGWLYRHGLRPDLFNENDPALIDQYGDCRKIAADRYIDDRNVGAIGWLLRRGI